MRKIAVVTGTRADYGIYRPILKAIMEHPELNLGMIVTGMHLDAKYGNTINLIKDEGFPIEATVSMLEADDSFSDMSRSIGKAILGMTDVFSQMQPNICLVLGDRGEMLAATIVCAHLQIPVAHLHGGEVSGTIDESVRHAITKLAHIHLPATKKSKERIIKLGEVEKNVFVVGAAGLDSILSQELPSKEELSNKYELHANEAFILIVQHPVTGEVEQAEYQMEQTLSAVGKLGIRTILVYPNSDAGRESMIEVIKQYEHKRWLTTHKSIPHKEYLGLLSMSSALVGNSSSGIIEAASFGLPVLNIGTRQLGRERAANVIDVAYDEEQITEKLYKIIFDQEYRASITQVVNPYGDGKTGPRVAQILAEIELDSKILQKQITY